MIFPVTIDYSQISVCDSKNLIFSQWQDAHVAQGFAWRVGHVSFGIPDHDGECLIETQRVLDFPPLIDVVVRAITVPFSAPHAITVATIMKDYPIDDLAAGEYSLQLRLIKDFSVASSFFVDGDYAYLLQFLFKVGKSEHFEILRSSDEMTTMEVLTKEATPA